MKNARHNPRCLFILHSPFSIAAAILAAGCTPAYRPHIRLPESIGRPDAAVLLITIDGCSPEVLDELLAAGKLPQIAGMIERGVRVRDARCSLPSLTYPNLTTILTGRQPAAHGVLGNHWFDRYALTYRTYTTMADYRLADGDIFVPTVYEWLGNDYGVSIQCAIRRGAARTIDNWASSGLRWFVGAYGATDGLIPLRFDTIAEEAVRRGRWPALIHAYFPGADEIGHRRGPDSALYRQELVNIDGYLGGMLEAVAQAGMAERTCTVLVSDHNHMPVPGANSFDVAGWLKRHGYPRVIVEPPPNEPWEARRRRYAKVDAVVVTGGDRFAAVHLRGANGWHERPTTEQIAALWEWGFDEALPQVGALAWSGRLEGPCTEALPDHARKAVEALLKSPRAGDLALFAADGWDFVTGGAGGHGGLGAADTRVPMIFSGDIIDRTAVIESAGLVDVTPTLLGLLRKRPADADRAFDGRDWSGTLTGAGP